MTFKNLLCVAAAAALMTSQAAAQVTSQGPGGTGPSIMIDLIRDNGAPVLGANGGLQYGIFVAPDASFGTFTGAGAGDNGDGGSLALEFGVTVSSGLFNATQGVTFGVDNQTDALNVGTASVQVNIDATAGSGNSNAANGLVEFANPGNQVFDFETPIFSTDSSGGAAVNVGGIQIGTSNGLDSIFAALGTGFITAADAGVTGGTPPAEPVFFEVLRFETTRLSNTNLDHTVSLVGRGSLFGGAADSVIVAQSTDLSDPNDPDSQNFTPATISDTDMILAGDANLDGFVNSADFSSLSGGFNGNGIWSVGDFNGDGVINSGDFSVLSGAFNTGSGAAPVVASTTAVPEPSAVLLLASAMLGIAGRRQK